MSKAVADRMLKYVWDARDSYNSWAEFYYLRAPEFLDKAIEAEQAGMPIEIQNEFFDYALACELTANLLDKMWLHRQREGVQNGD